MEVASGEWWLEKWKGSLDVVWMYLEENDIMYLKQDGMVLPDSVMPCLDEPFEDEYKESQPREILDHMSNLEQKISKTISRLQTNQGVVPYLDSKVPVDATWMHPLQTLACSNAGEILLLLKSSDRCLHSIQNGFLLFRPFHPSFQPSMEFRLFIRHYELVAISQRRIQSFFPYLVDHGDDIRSCLLEHWNRMKSSFSSYPLSSFVLDMIILEKKPSLMSIHPWHADTDPLLFTWDELAISSSHDVEWSILMEPRPISLDAQSYRVPWDLLNIQETM